MYESVRPLWDEERNLGGVGNLGFARGEPTSLLFETLRHREKDP
jgi:hypothetical protein